MKGQTRAQRLEEVNKILDSVTEVKETSQEEAMDLLEEIQAEVEGRIDGLKEDLEAQKE